MFLDVSKRQPHQAVNPPNTMRSSGLCRLKRDDSALTAVIEFLSAFALFLMILTAFLSLAQLQMGSNDPNRRPYRSSCCKVSTVSLPMEDGLYRWARMDWISQIQLPTGTWLMLSLSTMVAYKLDWSIMENLIPYELRLA